jgi:hypothetical protein
MSIQLGSVSRRLFTKRRYPAEVQSTIDSFERDFDALLADIRDDIADRLNEPGVTSPERAAELVVEEYDEEFRATLRQGATDGVGAGRRMASRRFDLDVQFDVVPERAIDAVEGVVAEHATDSLQEMGRLFRSDIETWLEDGLSIDDITEQMSCRIDTHGCTPARSCMDRHSAVPTRHIRMPRRSSASGGCRWPIRACATLMRSLTGRSPPSTVSFALAANGSTILATRQQGSARSLTAAVRPCPCLRRT